jgi:hypothetical protein
MTTRILPTTCSTFPAVTYTHLLVWRNANFYFQGYHEARIGITVTFQSDVNTGEEYISRCGHRIVSDRSFELGIEDARELWNELVAQGWMAHS